MSVCMTSRKVVHLTVGGCACGALMCVRVHDAPGSERRERTLSMLVGPLSGAIMF